MLEIFQQIRKKSRLPLISSKRGTEIRGSTWFIVFTITMAVFTDIFLYGIIVPVVPFAFEERMGVPHDQVQSKVSQNLAIYSAGLIVGSLTFGYICDRLKGRRAPMITGLILLVASTIILCLTKSSALFSIGRLILGISAGVVWTVGLAIIADTAPSDQIAYLMGYPGIGMSCGIFLGPLLGGVVYDRAGYYAVWYVCFGVLAMDIVLRLLMIERKDFARKMAKFGPPQDQQQQQQATESEKSATATETETEKRGEITNSDSEPLPESNEAEAQPEVVEGESERALRKKKYGRMPPMLVLLKYPRVWNVLLMSMVLAWIMTSLDTTMTIHLNQLFGFNSLGAGLVFLAIAVPSVLEPVAGKIADKWGPRYLVSIGYMFVGVFLILLRLPHYHSTQQVVLFVAMIALAGTAITMTFSPMLGELTNVVDKIEKKQPGRFGHGRGFGQAYGLFNVAFSVGALVGPFESGGVMENSGWNLTTLSLGIIAFITVVPAFLFTGGNLVHKWMKKRKPHSAPPSENDSPV